MSKKMKCVCDECDREFEYNLNWETVGKDKRGGDVRRSFLKCPHCGAVFYSAITDTVYEEMCEHYRKLCRRQAILVLEEKPADDIEKELNNYNQQVMLPYYNELKAKYNGVKHAE